MSKDMTILIAARNAEHTIGRAIRSALQQPQCPIVLIDDFSEDNTASIGWKTAGSRLTIIRPDTHRGLGHARKTGLNFVKTRYGMWLDADDELFPGRADRLESTLRNNHTQLALDAIDLYDGETNTLTQTLSFPSFLKNQPTLARLFERNYLHTLAPIAFETFFAKTVQYDSKQTRAEDSDFFLRAISKGAQCSLVETVGYRMYDYSNSLSRDLSAQRKMLKRALKKHSYNSVQTLYKAEQHSRQITLWGLISMATFCEDYPQALDFLEELHEITPDREAVLEPEGPLPISENWRLDFHFGTLNLLSENPKSSIPFLEKSNTQRSTPEGLNNLGVAYSRLNQTEAAQRCFKEAIQLFPDYSDAHKNLKAKSPAAITTHPLRLQSSRNQYS